MALSGSHALIDVKEIQRLIDEKQFDRLPDITLSFAVFRQNALQATAKIPESEPNTALFYGERCLTTLQSQLDIIKLIKSVKNFIPATIYQKIYVDDAEKKTELCIDAFLAYQFKNNGHKPVPGWDVGNLNIRRNTYEALLALSDPKIINSLRYEDLLLMIYAYSDDAVLMYIFNEAIGRVPDDARYYGLLQTTLRVAKEATNGEQQREYGSLPFSKECYPRLQQRYDNFKQTQADKIKTSIESVLEKAIAENSHQPWSLGFMGSNYKITYKDKTFAVPKGIYQLYHEVLLSHQQIAVTHDHLREIIDKREKKGNFAKFFKAVTGRGRSDQTTQTYANVRKFIV